MKSLRVAALCVLVATAAASLILDAPAWVSSALVVATLAAVVWREAGLAKAKAADVRADRLRREESIREQERFRCSRALTRRSEGCSAAGEVLRAAAFAEAAEIVYLADAEAAP